MMPPTWSGPAEHERVVHAGHARVGRASSRPPCSRTPRRRRGRSSSARTRRKRLGVWPCRSPPAEVGPATRAAGDAHHAAQRQAPQARAAAPPRRVALSSRPMSLFLLKRLATFVATLLAASVVIFLVLDILPGNAAQMMMGPTRRPRRCRRSPPSSASTGRRSSATWHWIGGLLTGDLGLSHAYSSPVAELIGERLRRHRAAGADGDGADDRRSRSAPASTPRRATTSSATSADGPVAARHRDPELLVRDPADPVVLGEAALVLGRRLSGLGRRRLAGVQGAAAAGGLARGGAGGDPGAHHALGGARGAARGLRAHRARQGRCRAARRCGATCCATR